MIPFNSKYLEQIMKNSDIMIKDDKAHKVGGMRLQLPDELVYTSYICPKAFAHYFPVWVGEQLAMRSEEPLRISDKISFEGISEEFIAGPKIKFYVVVEVLIQG